MRATTQKPQRVEFFQNEIQQAIVELKPQLKDLEEMMTLPANVSQEARAQFMTMMDAFHAFKVEMAGAHHMTFSSKK